MHTRFKSLILLGILIALGILLITSTQLAAQEFEPTPVSTEPPTLPATLPVPTIPVESHLWLPQLYNMVTPSATLPSPSGQ